jgi:hypothetical protein
MNAKQRYRQRLKLRAALARVLQVLVNNRAEKIPPDRVTGELAAQVVVWLVRFTVEAGMDLPDLSRGPELSRFIKLIRGRRVETRARYRRRLKSRLGGSRLPTAPDSGPPEGKRGITRVDEHVLMKRFPDNENFGGG